MRGRGEAANLTGRYGQNNSRVSDCQRSAATQESFPGSSSRNISRNGLSRRLSRWHFRWTRFVTYLLQRDFVSELRVQGGGREKHKTTRLPQRIQHWCRYCLCCARHCASHRHHRLLKSTSNIRQIRDVHFESRAHIKTCWAKNRIWFSFDSTARFST